MNHTFTVRIYSPLLRPGIEISFQVSGKYLTRAVCDAMAKVREINEAATNVGEQP